MSSKIRKPYRSWDVINVMRDQDSYAQNVPSFNIKGKDKVKTVFGGFISLVIAGVVLSYAVSGWIDLIQRANPVITESVMPNYYGENKSLNFNEANYRVAVATWNSDEK